MGGEVVERLARAMWEGGRRRARYYAQRDCGPYKAGDLLPPDRATWETVGEQTREGFRAWARDALEALGE